MRERHNEPENNLPSHVKLLISCTAIVFTLFCFILFQDLVCLVEWELYTDLATTGLNSVSLSGTRV